MFMKNATGTTGKSNKNTQSSPMGQGMDREKLISVAAYYRAENRDFWDGDALTDWLICEVEIDALLNNRKNL